MPVGFDDTPPPLNETTILPDVFVSGIARIEGLTGGCFRFVLYTDSSAGGYPERLHVLNVVIPIENVPGCIQQAVAALVGEGVKLLVRPPALVQHH